MLCFGLRAMGVLWRVKKWLKRLCLFFSYLFIVI